MELHRVILTLLVTFTKRQEFILKTNTIKEFIEKNSKCKIISGERLTPEGGTLYTAEDIKRSDRVTYGFEDGTSMTLTQADINSAPDFQPKWDLS